MASLVMAANMNNVGATTHNPMHSCKVCNKELDTEKALWLHMRSHGIHHYYSNYQASQNPQEPNMANCLVLLSNGTLKPLALVFTDSTSKRSHDGKPGPSVLDPERSIRLQDQSTELQDRGKFECKACNKVFTSHQALGGHRASHKKVKGCFAANVVASNLDVYENDDNLPPATDTPAPENRVSPPKKSNKIHECSICHKVFPSGQALGGHKRCHWLPYTLPPPFPPHITTAPPPPPQALKFHNFLDVDESQTYNMGANKKPRYTIISSPPDQNATPTVTFLGPMTKKAKTSNSFRSLHCSYKCKTTLSLFNDDEDLMPLKMQKEGKSSSWLHLGFGSSTASSEETA